MRGILVCALFGAISTSTLSQTKPDVEQVRLAQRAAYAIQEATNGCPVVGEDILGWPGAKVRKCIYQPLGSRLTGLVYLLDVPPEVIARWIETTCASNMPNSASCFHTVLTCGRNNSGMMLAVSGNVMENMDGRTWKNYFFRNGMTVSIGGETDGSTNQVSLERQEALARMPDQEITSIPSGMTRFWRTRPKEFASRYPKEKVPVALNSPEMRQRWLDIARAELLAALDKPTNRLLDAWVSANSSTLEAGHCPPG
jgi:hypothetical protein